MYGKGIGEPDAFRGKRVKVRRNGIRVTIATQVRADIFCGDKQNVRAIRHLLLLCVSSQPNACVLAAAKKAK